MIKGIAFTCYPVSDMAKARGFYEGILKLPPATSFGDAWQEYDIEGGTFAIVEMSEEAPEFYKNTRGTTIAFEVDDLQASLDALSKHNVRVLMEPCTFPACIMAVIGDPDNNIITLHQSTRKA